MSLLLVARGQFKGQSMKKRSATIHNRNITSSDLPENLDLNDKFKLAIDVMENTNLSVFVTGHAGTGKTTLEKYFTANTKKKIIVLAPTGVAALKAGGQTIHSFFQLPPKIIDKSDIKRVFHSVLIQKLDMVIIDEVSMCRADLMDGIDYALRVNREIDEPFGGVQMVFVGDLFQLPPVVEKEAREVLRKKYPTPYFFSAKVFDDLGIKYVELSKIYRQIDIQFIELLNRIRDKRHTEEDLKLLNTRVRKITARSRLDGAIVLTTTNHLASTINQDRLAKLPGREYSYKAIITGKFDISAYPTDTDIRLKEGAQIILIKNDPDKRWVNGTLAKVAELSNDSIQVDINGSTHKIRMESWYKIEYQYNEQEDKVESKIVGTFEQFPLRLAWALTIHKGQGQTLDKLVLDLGHGAFTHGQVYVALSRCPSLNGITLKRPIIHSDVIFDKRIYEFRERFINML